MKNMSWDMYYELAYGYFKKYGNLEIKQSYVTKNGVKLGVWINNQRRAYKKTLGIVNSTLKPLTDEQVELLENIGIVWDVYESNWGFMYDEACKYYMENHDLNIKESYITKSGVRLGIWLKNQRKAYKKRFVADSSNTLKPLTDEQVGLLESIGIIWDVCNNSWETMYDLARKYYVEHHNLDINRFYVCNGFNLGRWISVQREKYMKQKLTQERIDLLENIGMIWSPREYDFVNTLITKEKQRQLEKRFLEFLSGYIKENKNEIESIEDVRNIEESFVETFGCEENHYKPFTKLKK